MAASCSDFKGTLDTFLTFDVGKVKVESGLTQGKIAACVNLCGVEYVCTIEIAYDLLEMANSVYV